MTRRTSRRTASVAVVIGWAMLAACGGSDASSSARDDAADGQIAAAGTDATDSTDAVAATSEAASAQDATTTEPAPLAVASAQLIETNVDYRTGAQAEFVTLDEPVEVAVGDTVRTDVTGYGEIVYFDGSLTRLDVDTEFEVLALTDDPGSSEIRTRMGTGRTWHRVEQLTGDDSYVVETSVATATVRGTAFAIGCSQSTTCRFDVADGSIEIELPDGTTQTLTAPAGVEVGPAGFGDVAVLPFDGMFGDDWMFDNADRDTGSGYDAAATVYQAYGPSTATLSGTYSGTVTSQPMSDCIPDCSFWVTRNQIVIDLETKPRTFVIDLDCSKGVPCEGTGEIERGSGVATAPLTFDGAQLTFLQTSESGSYCTVNDDSEPPVTYESGQAQVTSGYQLEPTSAAVVDGRWVVETLSGGLSFRYDVVEAGDCPTYSARDGLGDFPASGGYSQHAVIEMTRTS